ncbi:MAG TPA: hypothetical protein VFG48_04825, partial [Xanthomonadales bacterium]|nr:hypothetical protein [Xanthomonadales bacterium]
MTHCTSPFRNRVNAARSSLYLLVLLAGLVASATAAAQGQAQKTPSPPLNSAPVIIDGQRLFELRGVTAYPAEQRAAAIREAIVALAANERFDPAELSVREQ